MNNPKILVVDDDPDLMALIETILKREGFDVSQATKGADCLPSARSNVPDLIILDLMLPDKDGFEVLAELQGDSSVASVPVVILSAKDDSVDIVRGLEMGADDYIVKPFNKEVLTARVRSILRRRQAENGSGNSTIQVNGLTIDSLKHEVLVDNSPIELTTGEFNLLYLLAKRRGAVLTRAQIIKGLHGEACEVTDRSVDVQLVGIRKKLGRLGKCLVTVRGVGYRLKEHP